MRRAERLFRLIALMRANELSRGEDLAKTLEVSVRTIYRDIAHLQGSGLPVEGAAGVGYILRQGFDLPAMTFTYEQMDALALGLKFVEEAGDKEMVLAAKEVRGKIETVLPDQNKTALSDAPFFAARTGLRAPPFTKKIRMAIRGRQYILISYQDANGTITKRQIRPLSLTVFTDGWMIAGWCERRKDFRYFRLDRILNFEVLDLFFPIDRTKNLTAFRNRTKHSSVPY